MMHAKEEGKAVAKESQEGCKAEGREEAGLVTSASSDSGASPINCSSSGWRFGAATIVSYPPTKNEVGSLVLGQDV